MAETHPQNAHPQNAHPQNAHPQNARKTPPLPTTPLLTTLQMAEFAARGVLRFDAVVPAELNERAIAELRGWGVRPFARPTPASLTPLSQCYSEAVIGEVLRLPIVAGIIASLVGPAFRQAGDAILLIGDATTGLAGSAYATLAGVAIEDDPPGLDLGREAAVQAFICVAIGRRLVASAQDIAGGGLAVALAECAMWGGLGGHVRVGQAGSPAAALFGESPSRLVLSCQPVHAPALELLARQFGLPVERIGSVGGDALTIESIGSGATGAAEERGSRVADALEVPLADLRHAWDHGLARALGWEG